MKVKITIECNNTAFAGNPSIEVARILRVVVARVEEITLIPGTVSHLSDSNGNKIGEFKVTK